MDKTPWAELRLATKPIIATELKLFIRANRVLEKLSQRMVKLFCVSVLILNNGPFVLVGLFVTGVAICFKAVVVVASVGKVVRAAICRTDILRSNATLVMSANRDFACVAANWTMSIALVASPSTLWHFGGLRAAKRFHLVLARQAFRAVHHNLRVLITANNLCVTTRACLTAVGKVAEVLGLIRLIRQLDSEAAARVNVDLDTKCCCKSIRVGMLVVVIIHSPDQNTTQTLRLEKFGLELPSIPIIVRNPLIVVPLDCLDCSVLVKFGPQLLLANEI
ncbi:hypothetical protein HG531_008427 [Fusarium graminearum]|nr:hypothetical protein HG531_008427 [Fusarium graminearum]